MLLNITLFKKLHILISPDTSIIIFNSNKTTLVIIYILLKIRVSILKNLKTKKEINYLVAF